ncbi:hypothetical protein GKE82_00770 [Conexibacter sp. W3-3-2]|uniref:Uncharacterized protein n=1 Tax=Paraconexibacter algicola TaxID=2133960 RepID=A0A2T4UEK1_9ACTN|nr:MULTISPECIES: hypothetical protein [Solirubrobacterales]MTD42872.1 hypothetical protein [Conexibacter sp. W3-3-2]PTL56211.1 hypothetical protein C7Y72_14585 [Paraconexibacter algicola]
MTPMLAKIVDVETLWQTIWSATLTGVGVSVVFALTVVGFTRWTDLRRDGRTAPALAYGLLALAGVAGTAGSIVYAIVLITSK